MRDRGGRFCSRVPRAKRHSVMVGEPHGWLNRMDRKSALLSAPRRRGICMAAETAGT